MSTVRLYDTTLRDGAQQAGISFSVEDKLKICQKLEELGIDYIEGGWPGSNPRDAEFFQKMSTLSLDNAKIAVFGSTRRVGMKVKEDNNLVMLVKAGVEVATIVGKSSESQVIQVLETTLEENLNMIAESVRFLKEKGMTVFFDAEHFFDGFRTNSDYALRCLSVAAESGVDCVVLCDTNGGAMLDEVTKAVNVAAQSIAVPLGIHVHNDSGLAVANTMAAVQAGVTHIQGTINGYGERCGNANLCAIIPNLKLKMGVDCVTEEQLAKLTNVSHYISEMANLVPDPFAPYVGVSAFSHKAGYHVAGITKWADSYQHINPSLVGNRPHVVVSELAGKRTIVFKAKERGLPVPKSKEIQNVLEQIKLLEKQGFQYDVGEASFDLLLHRAQTNYRPPFELVDFMVVVEKRRRPPSKENLEELLSEATIKVRVDGKIVHTAAEGDGPVNALDQALRKALLQFYPNLADVKLIDYKVRILEETAGTASQVRVLIESSDGRENWRTVGCSTNIIEASWLALADSIEYWLIKQNGKA